MISTTKLLPTLALVALGSFVGSLRGDEPGQVDLAPLIESTRKDFDLARAVDVTAARSGLQTALDGLNQYLRAQGANGDEWRSYLLLEHVAQQLTPGAELNLPLLEEIYRRSTGGYEGLELAPFTTYAQALLVFLDTVRLAALPQPFSLDEPLKIVAASAARTSLSVDQATELETALEQLEATRGAPRLVTALRERFSGPNLLVQVSAPFLLVPVNRELNNETPIRQSMGRTRVRGTARMVGALQGRLSPDPNRAVFLSELNGTMHMRATAVSGPAVVCTLGQATLFGHKELFIDEFGVTTATATTRVSLRNGVSGVGSTKCGLVGNVVQRIAAKKAPGEVAKNHGSTTARVRQMFTDRFNNEADEKIKDVNDAYQNKVRLPLVRFQAFPRLFRFQTEAERLLLTIAQDRRGRLAAVSAPPALKGEHDLVVRLHESFLNNTFESILGGRRITKDDVIRISRNLTGKEPENIDAGDEEDERGPWSISFPTRDPVSLRVEKNLLTLVIRGTKYTSGSKSYDAMNITARYLVAPAGDGLTLTRQGDLEIAPPDFKSGQGQTLNSRQTVLRNLLQKRLVKVFEQEILLDTIRLSGAYDSVGALKIHQWFADSGWLLLAWQAEHGGVSEVAGVAHDTALALE